MSPSNEYSGLIFFRTDSFIILTLFLNRDTYLESNKIIGGITPTDYISVLDKRKY